MHARVAAAVSAFAARRVHDNRAIHFSRGRVEMNCAALESEFSMDGVEVAAERKFNFRLCRVKLNSGFLRGGRGRENQCGQSGKNNEDD